MIKFPLKLAILLAAPALVIGCTDDPFLGFLQSRDFKVASRSMMPEFEPEQIIPITKLKVDAELKRGDVVIVTIRGQRWLVRLAALPGDRIMLESGIVRINGQVVAQEPAGTMQVDGPGGVTEAEIFIERFPGEETPHRIIDTMATVGDNFGLIHLPPDTFFMLGDNRDNSADSRFADSTFGLGVVKREQIIGRLER